MPPTPDLTADEKAALITELGRIIAADPFPMSPRVRGPTRHSGKVGAIASTAAAAVPSTKTDQPAQPCPAEETRPTMKLGCFALLAITCYLIQDAKADWQYTRWGMTPQQVVAASRGTAWLTEDNGSYNRYLAPRYRTLLLARSQIKINNYSFLVGFWFEPEFKKLTKIMLISNNCGATDAVDLRELLTAKYGPPREIMYGLGHEWVNRPSRNIITFTHHDKDCMIEYRPIPTEL